MKKVLYVDTPIDPPGGGQNSLLLILQSLNKNKFHPIVFIPNECEFTSQLDEINISHKIVKSYRLFSEIKNLNPKVIHCNSATTRYTFYTALWAKLLKIPFIWHVRVVESGGWRDKVIVSLSARIIVISEAVKSKIAYVRNDKVVKIYNAVDTKIFKPGLEMGSLYKEFNIDKSKKVIGIFSRLDWWKGHKLFLDSAKLILNKVNNVIFLIVGEGDVSYKKELINYTENLRLKDCVIFTGSRKDIPQLMNLCDVVVSTSIEPEPFGRTIIEAMACAKPVVATNIGAPKEIITHFEDGYLTSLQPEEVAQAIILFLNDSTLRMKVSTNARKKAEEYFSINSQIQQIEDLYNEILCG